MAKRLFVAVQIIPEQKLREFFFELKANLNHERIKWVEENNMHFTLKFLGDTPENKITDIINKLKLISKDFQTFTVLLKGLGLFGPVENPRVLYTNIESGNTLENLCKGINEALHIPGLGKELRKFTAHLTLGRIKYISDSSILFTLIDKYKDIFLQEVKTEEIILYESILNQQGPKYKIISRFKLASTWLKE